MDTVKHINTFLQLAFVLFLFWSVFVVKIEFFNGIVTGKQHGLEMGVAGIAVYLIFTLPFAKFTRISLVDISVLIFCIWFLLNELITGFSYISFEHAVFITLLWLAIYLFTRQSSSKQEFTWGVISIWLVIVLIQASMGLMQLHGKTTSLHSLFNITGTFHNPGPFAGFVVSALPLALGVVLALQQHDYTGKNYRILKLWKWPVKLHDNALYLQKAITYLGYGVVIALLLVIPAARPRAAWIAGLAGCAYVLWKHPVLAGYRYKITSFFKRMPFFPRLTVIALSFTLLLSAGTGLYFMKQGSASGRLLMWQVTWELVEEKPLFGHGTSSFNALYMPAQARWFESGKGTQAQVMVAGSPQASFNELIGLWLETNERCLIASYDKIMLHGDTIFILSRSNVQKAIFAFNINVDFLFKIDSRGRGPGEYQDISDFYINNELKYIGVLSYSKIIKYDFKGDYSGITIDLSQHNVLKINYQDGNLYAYAPDARSRFAKKSVAFAAFDPDGNLLYKDIPELKNSLYYSMNKENYLSNNTTHTFFNPFGNDTIYQVREDFLAPKFVLNFGKHHLPGDTRHKLLSEGIFNLETSEYLIKNDYVWFGIHSFHFLDDYVVMHVPKGDILILALYSLNSGNIRNMISKTEPGILFPNIKGSSSGRLIGVYEAMRIEWLKNHEQQSELFGKNSEFFLHNLNDYNDVREDDNSIILIFNVRDF